MGLKAVSRSLVCILLALALGGWRVGSIIQTPSGAQFLIERVLGQGGFGQVVLARRKDPRSSRLYGSQAIKFFFKEEYALEAKSFYEGLFESIDVRRSRHLLPLELPYEATIGNQGS
jgi:hypothetical protein